MQMGSCMKKSIFDEQTSMALKKWHMTVRKRQLRKEGKSLTRTPEGSTSHSTVNSSSPGHTLHRFKTTGHSTHSSAYVEHDESDYEADKHSPNYSASASLIVRLHRQEEMNDHPLHAEESSNEDEISLAKPPALRET